MSDRSGAIAAFLAQAGWGAASRRFLAGDASARRYERLSLGGTSAVLMDAPPGQADDAGAFLRIAAHLRGLGLSAPEILAADLTQGLLLTEDFGDGVFARLIDADPHQEGMLCAAAVDVLVRLQSAAPAPGLPDLTAQDWAEAACLAPQWYGAADPGIAADCAPFQRALTDAMGAHADGTRVMILRDYHAENLLWLPGRADIARVGLLDFQLAQMGQPGYDLVSLCQDARRDVSPQTEAVMIRRFLDLTGGDAAAFGPAYATLGAQRALRILGIFARLARAGGKPAYVALIPRVWAQLQRNLAHPALRSLAAVCSATLPEPTTAHLERIRIPCAPSPC